MNSKLCRQSFWRSYKNKLIKTTSISIPHSPHNLSLRFKTSSIGGIGSNWFCRKSHQREDNLKLTKGYDFKTVKNHLDGSIFTGKCRDIVFLLFKSGIKG